MDSRIPQEFVDFNHCKIIAAAATDDSEEKFDETLAKNDEL